MSQHTTDTKTQSNCGYSSHQSGTGHECFNRWKHGTEIKSWQMPFWCQICCIRRQSKLCRGHMIISFTLLMFTASLSCNPQHKSSHSSDYCFSASERSANFPTSNR